MNLFLDTNVLYDYISGRMPFFDQAQKLTIMKMFGDVSLYVSGKSYTDVFYILKKERDSQDIQDSILDSLAVLEVCSLEAGDIEAACQLGWEDFEDALIAVSAAKVGADYLVTRDKSFAGSRVPVRTPEEIVEIFRLRGLTYDVIDLDELELDEVDEN